MIISLADLLLQHRFLRKSAPYTYENVYSARGMNVFYLQRKHFNHVIILQDFTF